jgi:hypothetical protein
MDRAPPRNASTERGDIVKTQAWLTKTLPLAALAIGLAVAAAMWSAPLVTAIGSPDLQPVEFGLLGVAPGQTARLTVVNPALQPPATGARARSVRLTFGVMSLGPGEAVSLAFTATAPDTFLSATALGGPDTSPTIGNPDLVPTLEVVEGSRTVYTHPALVKGFNPQPDPPGAR